jgi:hypothetical protein
LRRDGSTVPNAVTSFEEVTCVYTRTVGRRRTDFGGGQCRGVDSNTQLPKGVTL